MLTFTNSARSTDNGFHYVEMLSNSFAYKTATKVCSWTLINKKKNPGRACDEYAVHRKFVYITR